MKPPEAASAYATERPSAQGEYLVEGVKFQMGGWWVMDFDITANGRTERVRFNLQLKKYEP